MEPFLLADFIRPEPGSRCLDVGTGCGIIPLLLLTRQPDLFFTAVEIQESLLLKAQSNLKETEAGQRVELFHADFLEWSGTDEAGDITFDWIISNPPYRKLNSGRINPDREKALARHEIALTLEALVDKSARHLKPGGCIALAYPLERLEEVKKELLSKGLTPIRIRHVCGREDSSARFFLVIAQKGAHSEVCDENTFFIYEESGAYTAAMKSIYESFNYPGRSHRDR